GQEVATLVNNEVVTPGTKEVTFTGNDLSSGIYFYTLFAGDFKETKKMMLIK
ncbi:MAG TPA: peptidase S8, partial [Bacteroidetes bacterium]|nr:peptidase S8 [Bacteroidota bacterium]